MSITKETTTGLSETLRPEKILFDYINYSAQYHLFKRFWPMFYNIFAIIFIKDIYITPLLLIQRNETTRPKEFDQIRSD